MDELGPEREDHHAAEAHHVGGGHEHARAAGHDHQDEHAADEGEPLGPVDWGAWRAGALGVAIGGLVALSFYVAVGHI